MNTVEIKNLTKRYNDFVLDDISFDIPTGSIVGLVGENGAGKSTTIGAILNTVSYDGGSISVFGNSNLDKSFDEAKQDIGIVIDGAAFPESFTIKDAKSVLKETYDKFNSKCFDGYIDTFNLPLKKKFKEFSRGMLMKFSIASALSHSPRLLILDEATAGLDPLVREGILDILNEYTRDEKNTILITSHIVSDLEKICDYIVFIHQGKLIVNEEKDLLMEKYALLKTDDIESIAPEAIVRKKKTSYGYDLLVQKDKIPSSFRTELTTLEDIVIFLSR